MPTQPLTTLYFAYWYDHAVFKIGVTDRSDRIRTHQAAGATILHTLERRPRVAEREAIKHVGYAFDRAFKSAEESVPVLGPYGLGYTECFAVPTRHLLGALELAFMGVRRNAHEENPHDQARVLH